MDDLKVRGLINRLKKELLPALERKIYRENIEFVTFKKEEKVAFHLVYDKNDSIKWWFFEHGGYTKHPCRNLLEMEHLPKEEVRLTSSFWTCECESYFIHHMAQEKCPICRCHRTHDTELLRTLKGT